MYMGPMQKLLSRLRPMRVDKSIPVTVSGVLTVVVSVIPAQGYVTTSFYVGVGVDAGFLGPATVWVAYGDGPAIQYRESVGSSWTYYHTYATPGTYQVRAHVDDDGTGMSGDSDPNDPYARAEVRSVMAVTFTADKTSGNVPLAVTFTIGISAGYDPWNWTINYGDGSTPESGSAIPAGVPFTRSHTYTKVGSYTATLTVIDALGEAVSGQATISAGVIPTFPKLREMFPKLFEKIDEIKSKIPSLAPIQQ